MSGDGYEDESILLEKTKRIRAIQIPDVVVDNLPKGVSLAIKHHNNYIQLLDGDEVLYIDNEGHLTARSLEELEESGFRVVEFK